MSIEWVDTMSEGLLKLRAAVAENIDEAVAEGAEVILLDSDERMPKESGHLAGTGKVNKARGGSKTVGITYDGPYARWVHEHLFFRHPHGGQAKFLETAMLLKGRDAINAAGQSLWRKID